MLASAGTDATIRIWQPGIGRLVRFLRLESPPTCLLWDSSGEAILVGCEDGTVLAIDPDTVEVMAREKLCDDWIYSLAWRTNGRLLAGTSRGRIIELGRLSN